MPDPGAGTGGQGVFRKINISIRKGCIYSCPISLISNPMPATAAFLGAPSQAWVPGGAPADLLQTDDARSPLCLPATHRHMPPGGAPCPCAFAGSASMLPAEGRFADDLLMRGSDILGGPGPVPACRPMAVRAWLDTPVGLLGNLANRRQLLVGVLMVGLALSLPGLSGCLFLGLTGLPCPGCGATRSLAAMATLHPLEALRWNPGLWCGLAATLGVLLTGRRSRSRLSLAAKAGWATGLVLGMIRMAWIVVRGPGDLPF